MRRGNIIVFDDFITPGSTSSSQPAMSPAELNARLGAFDQIALHAIVQDANANGTLGIYVQNSADGVHWVFRQNNTTTASNGGDIAFTSLSATAVNQGAYLDTGATPLLAFVRIIMWFNGSTSGGRARIFATQRDQGG